MVLPSGAKRHSVGWPESLIFFTGKMGVHTGEVGQETIAPALVVTEQLDKCHQGLPV